MFHVEHRDGSVAYGGGNADCRELTGFPATVLGGGWFTDENPSPGPHQTGCPQHCCVRGSETSAHCRIEARHPLTIIAQGLDIGAHHPSSGLEVKCADGPMDEVRPLFASIHHRYPEIRSRNGNHQTGDSRTSAKINDGAHVSWQRADERLGVHDDLGNRSSTQHSDALCFA